MRSKGSGAAAGSSWRLVTWPAPTTTGTRVQSVMRCRTTDRVSVAVLMLPRSAAKTCLRSCLGLRAISEVSTSVASDRSAATVHFSRGRTLKGSYWKSRMAFSWVILLTSASDTPSRYFMAISGAWGQVESEWG